MQQQLKTGVPVHYTAYNRTHLAALLIGWDKELKEQGVDLAVFTAMPSITGKKNYGLQFHQEVRYDPDCGPGTWHWLDSCPEEEKG